MSLPSCGHTHERPRSASQPLCKNARILVVLHVGWPAEWPYYQRYLSHLGEAGVAYDLYVTAHEGASGGPGMPPVTRYTLSSFPNRGEGYTCLIRIPNRGLDAGGWLAVMDQICQEERRYDYVLKLHTKSTKNFGPSWRSDLVESILGSPARARQCIRLLDENPRIGMVASQAWITTEPYRKDVDDTAQRIGLPAQPLQRMTFVGGTMFWARWDAVGEPFMRKPNAASLQSMPAGFPPGESDGHFVERVFGNLVTMAAMDIKGVPEDPSVSLFEDEKIERPQVPRFKAGPVVPSEAKRDIDLGYERARTEYSDIFEHVPLLRELASEDDCRHVTELGSRTAVSTYGWLSGLLRGDNWPGDGSKKRLVCVDLDWHPNLGEIARLARAAGVSFEFRLGNDIETVLEDTDVLFIDTWHVYGWLKREFECHHAKVRKYIVMHDTTVDEERGESLRMRHDIAAKMRESGLSLAEVTTGLGPAVKEFLVAHADEWKLKAKLTNCNGLTILERIGRAPAA